MSLRVSGDKSAFVQKIGGTEAISSPRKSGTHCQQGRTAPLSTVYAFHLQKVSSSVRVSFLNEALRSGNMFSLWHWLKECVWKLFPSLMTVSCAKPRSPSSRVYKQASHGPSSWDYLVSSLWQPDSHHEMIGNGETNRKEMTWKCCLSPGSIMQSWEPTSCGQASGEQMPRDASRVWQNLWNILGWVWLRIC